MRAFRVTIDEEPTNTDPIFIVPVSDTHFGTIAHDRETWLRVKKFILENDRCYWFGLGDYADFIPPKDKRFDARILSPRLRKRTGDIITASIEEVVEEFRPIKNKLLFLISGNHDDKYRKQVGVDIVKLIAERLDIKQDCFPYEALVKIFFGSKGRFSLRMYASHGFGGGLHKGAKINRAAHVAQNFEADIIVAGHSHDMVVAPSAFLRTNSKGTSVVESIRWLVRVSGFRKSRSPVSDYEEFSGMPPNVTGTVAIEVYRGNDNGNSLRTNIRFLT